MWLVANIRIGCQCSGRRPILWLVVIVWVGGHRSVCFSSFGLVDIVRVTAKQSNNKARGRAAHPGGTHETTTPTLKGLHKQPCRTPSGFVHNGYRIPRVRCATLGYDVKTPLGFVAIIWVGCQYSDWLPMFGSTANVAVCCHRSVWLPPFGLAAIDWVTATQSNNKARGRTAHPGGTHKTTTPTLRGVHMTLC